VALSERGAALLCALRSGQSDGSPAVLPAGYGVLRGDRLVGYLEGTEAEAVGLLTGDSGLLTRSVPDGQGGTVTLQVRGSAAIAPRWNPDGTPAPLTVTAALTAVPAELSDPEGTKPDDDCFRALSAALDAQISADINAALACAQTLDADFLGLGALLRRSSPQRFAALPADWLQALEFDVHTEIRLVHSDDLGDPVGTEGGRK